MVVTAKTQTRYDFGRVMVEHVGPREYHVQPWGTDNVISISKRGITLRVQQSSANGPDEAMFTLLEDDARDLANRILVALEDQ